MPSDSMTPPAPSPSEKSKGAFKISPRDRLRDKRIRVGPDCAIASQTLRNGACRSNHLRSTFAQIEFASMKRANGQVNIGVVGYGARSKSVLKRLLPQDSRLHIKGVYD